MRTRTWCTAAALAGALLAAAAAGAQEPGERAARGDPAAPSCEALLGQGTEHAWAGRTRASLRAFRTAGERCPERRAEALLGEGRTLRWANRLRAAERVYLRVRETGGPEAREQARVGLGLVSLDQRLPRRALARFDSLLAEGSDDPGAHEGRALALAALGLRGGALATLARARRTGAWGPWMDRVEAEMRAEGRPTLGPAAHAFDDADGTRYRAAELAGRIPAGADGGVALRLRRAVLERGPETATSTEAFVAWEGRAGAALGLRAVGGLRAYEEGGFTPLEAEAGVAWTPGDRVRVDLSAARITVPDNLAAVREELVGTMAGAGVDARVTAWTTAVAALDVTRWSEGNTRVRARASLRHRLEGVPEATLEWPTLYQRYSEPFDFVFFSPPSYVETGPSLTLYRRVRRVWHLSAYGRGGAQKEEGQPWRALGTARVSVERQVAGHWGVRAEAAWTNSNVSGTAGFERTAVSLSVLARP